MPATPDGLRIADVLPDGPAATLSAGDIIVDVNGRPVASTVVAREILENVQPGQELTLRIRRDGVLQPVRVTVLREPARVEPPPRPPEFLGMVLEEDREGRVVVSRVIPGSPASAAGVLRADVLTRVEDHRVTGVPSLLDYVGTLLATMARGDQVDIEALRGAERIGFRIPVPDREVVATAATIERPAITVPASEVVFCMEVREYGAGRVVVLNVMEGSPAHAAGIRSGDVISSVGDRDVRTAAQLADAVTSYNRGDKVTFGVVRDGQLSNVDVTMAPCEYSRPPQSPADLETAAQQIRLLRSQLDELHRTVEVLSYTIERMRSQQ
jgi:S1-C subfamily serine protease